MSRAAEKIQNTSNFLRDTSYILQGGKGGKGAKAAERRNERTAVNALPLSARAPLRAHPPLVISINLPEHTHMSSYRRMVPYMHGVRCALREIT